MRLIFALLAGGLFGVGLVVSGMTDTEKVRGFLDLFGAWDPTLAFVMGGALIPMAVAWRVAHKRQAPVLGGAFPTWERTRPDPELAIGALLFGAGWGLAGFCPGPAVASLGFGGWTVWVFFGAMVAGMVLTPWLRPRLGLSRAAA